MTPVPTTETPDARHGYHVAENGNDQWGGTLPDPNPGKTDGPFATLERARDAIREARQHGIRPPDGWRVQVRGGSYFLPRTLEFTAADSGSANIPIVYFATPGEEVRLIGGRQIRFTEPVRDQAILQRLPAEARPHVRQCDLHAQGIHDYGVYHPRGHSGGSAHAALELFYDGNVMTVARWPKQPPLPNRGFVDITDCKDGRLYYDDARPQRWTSFDDVHLHGYFACDWASTIVRVTGLDPVAMTIVTDPPNVSAYGARKGGRFFFFNVLDELGEPGEWYLDRKTGILYFWPPTPSATGEAIVSTLDAPLIRLCGVDHIRFERLTLEAMRGDGVCIEGGADNVIAGCTLRNIGRHGVSILDGFDHQVLSCDIHETGECGVDILAGDRKTLTPCRHRVHNCHLHHIAREGWTYFDAVRMAHNLDKGCGAIISNNRMHEHRHALIHYKGNDHLIERNELYNMTLEGDDCGAMYTGRDFAMQGNIVRHNHIHHVGDSGRNDWGSFGVYMDDCGGGTAVYGNVFHWIDKAILGGGGVNIRIHDNIFVDCNPAVWFDERGASAGADGPQSMVHETMRHNFEYVNAHQPGPYQKYPNIEKIIRAFKEHLGVYTWGGGVFRNVVFGTHGAWLATYWTTFPPHFEFHDNLVGEDPGFLDPDFDRYALRDDAPAYRKIGIARIPFESIGLVRDEYRTQLIDTQVRLETLQPISGKGERGRARLTIRNTGDRAVAGEEIVEFKIRRHGPGIGFVRVPYQVAPGQTGVFDFDVALDPELLKGHYELFLCSRGEKDLRPFWTKMPIAYVLDSALTLVAPLAVCADAHPARVNLMIKNVGDQTITETVQLKATPPEGIHWLGPNSFTVHLRPGSHVEKEFAFESIPTPGPLLSRLLVESSAQGIKPARLPMIVEYPLTHFRSLGDLQDLPALLAKEPEWPVRGRAKNTLPGYFGDIQLAIAGDELVLRARINDPQPRQTPMIWDGSSIELYGCSPDRERIGHVFGNIPIGQVYLVPGVGDQPARGLIEKDNSQVFKPEIHITSEACRGGYVLRAAVPLPLIAVSPGNNRFLLEIQVNTPQSENYLAARGNLFNSYSAFNDTTQYAMMVVQPPKER